ncbi:hypothetical protein MTR_6g452950 [Medicago truncatula]|uniref:Uncharacterized protein n=1 Tax=Medicago truncatula TaxID=3880 RepID=A0A072U955_MEDTR|nr:hypothetical protein MTR_6g452950 [Medicago truncatula]
MVSVSCTPKPLDVLNGFQQVKKTKDPEPLPSFSFGLTQLEEDERNGFWTTCFDALVRAVDSENVKEEFLAKGYTHLLIQMGRGSYVPKKAVSNIISYFPSLYVC